MGMSSTGYRTSWTTYRPEYHGPVGSLAAFPNRDKSSRLKRFLYRGDAESWLHSFRGFGNVSRLARLARS